MLTFTCSLEEFYKLGKEFHLSLEKCKDANEAEAGWKCVGLHYLGIEHKDEVSRIFAAQRLSWWGKQYIKWQVENECRAWEQLN